jgi:hypothetical protein
MILTLARIVGAEPAGLKLVTELRGGLGRVRSPRAVSHAARVSILKNGWSR